MDKDKYLNRINVAESVCADYRSLRLIQENHMLSVPFENLYIVAGLPIKLDLQLIYNKIVVQRRGGYCYEINGLLYWLLKTLGFSVSMLSGRVGRDDGTFGPEFDHMTLLVHLDDKDYIVDAGFGDSVRRPLPITGEIVTDISGMYRVERDYNASLLYFQKRSKADWVSEFVFSTEPRQLDEFREMNVYQQTSAESHFTRNLVCSIATSTGRLSMSGDSMIETIGLERTRRPITCEDERRTLLEQYFGIQIARHR